MFWLETLHKKVYHKLEQAEKRILVENTQIIRQISLFLVCPLVSDVQWILKQLKYDVCLAHGKQHRHYIDLLQKWRDKMSEDADAPRVLAVLFVNLEKIVEHVS